MATSNVTTNRKKRKPTCLTCKLKKGCKNKKIGGYGDPESDVLVVIGQPTEKEDWKGKLKIDPNLAYIQQTLKRERKSCTFIHAVRCWSEKEPSESEIIACAEHLYRQLDQNDYTDVFLVGKIAVDAFFAYQENDYAAYSKLRGMTIPDHRFDLQVSVIHEPSHEIGNVYGNEQLKNTFFKSDLKQALKSMGKSIPKIFLNPKKCLVLCNEKQAVKEMKAVLDGKYTNFISFDFETTGLRPYNKGHRILSCAIATSKKKSFSFIMTKETTHWLKRILRNPSIPKIAANMKFEKTWAKVCLNCSINGLIHDTVLAGHIIDNRSGITSVKFQSFANFGIFKYEEAVGTYIKGSKEDETEFGANAFNRMHECPEQMMLEYVAMDSLLEYWIACKQKKVLGI